MKSKPILLLLLHKCLMCYSVLFVITIAAALPSDHHDAFVIIANATEIESPDFPATDVINNELTPVQYHGAQLWRIPFEKQIERNAISELQTKFDVSMWYTNGTFVDLFIRQSILPGARVLLDAANVPYNVIISDVQQQIDIENPPKEVIQELQNRKGHRLTWSAYHRVDDIHGYLNYLANTYPDICSVQDIGKSAEGRPLKVLRISNGGPENAAIWIDGGIHAREWISPASVTYIINQLTEEWEEQPKFIQNIDWYFLPVANPDGYEYTHKVDRLWRKNRGGIGAGRCAGVDLNRNFGYKWGGQGASKQPCSEIFAGTAAFSEPETRAQKMFMEQSAANFVGFLSFHSYGQYILYPWGYDRVVPPDYKELNRVGVDAAMKMKSIAGMKYSVGPSGSLLYPASGASDDWAKGTLGIKYTYTVELRDSGRYGFILPAEYIETTAKEALELVKVVASAVYEDEERK